MNPLAVWEGALRRLQARLPPLTFASWVGPLRAESADDGLRLSCPTPFHRDRVRDRLLGAIEQCVADEAGGALPVCLTVCAPSPATSAHATSGAPAVTGEAPRAVPPAAAPARGLQPALPLPCTFDTFVVGPCNALAQAASLEVASGRSRLSPLYLAAHSGLGKTHLARALVSEVARRGPARVIYAPAERFTNELTSAIRSRNVQVFKRRYRECDVLVLEDVQFVHGKQSTQLELFHTIDHLLNAGRRVVLTADRLPREIPEVEPRLRSRMASGLVAEMEPPDAQVRRRILRAKAAAGGVRVPEECLDRLVEAVRGSVRDLEAVLIQLVATAALLKRRIDLSLTEDALRKVEPEIPASGAPLPLKTVIGAVAAFFQVPPAALASRSRRRDVLVPRQLAMYLCHRYTDAALPEIGRAFGRKHPSVANAIAAVERRILEHAPQRYQVEALCERLDALSRLA